MGDRKGNQKDFENFEKKNGREGPGRYFYSAESEGNRIAGKNGKTSETFERILSSTA